ncbi:MAG: type II secretion system protein GspN [Desulfobulbus sp.]|nr:type II secretion system protein GspN [Desulfobulbus sp.]
MRINAKKPQETQGRNGRWRRRLGYVVYTLVAAAVTLWLLFPAESARRLLVRSLSGLVPGIEWRVARVKLHLPFILRVTGVEGYTDPGSEHPSLRIDQLELWPDWEATIRAQGLWLNYHLHIGSGVLEGRLCRAPSSQVYSFHGSVRALQVESIPLLANGLGRNLQGTMTASYEGEGSPEALKNCTWKVQGKLENGHMALVRPVLRHKDLPFSLVNMLLHGVGGAMTIAEGKIDSPLGQGWFNGTLVLAADPMQSQLQVRGGLHPQPFFFEGVENTVALQSVRLELQEKPLPFSLSGTLLHPGIYFEGLAMQMYALEKEMR